MLMKPMQVAGRPTWRLHVAVIVVCTILGVLLLNNLIFNIDTAVPETFVYADFGLLYWGLWWGRFSITELGQSPYFTNWVLFPFEHNLVLHNLPLFWSPIYAALELFVGRMTAFNLIILANFPLTAYFMFLFLRRRTRVGALAALGGVMFAFAPYMGWRALDAHINLQPMWWLPLTLLAWDRAVEANRGAARRAWLWAVGAGACVFGAWMTDVQFLLWLPPVIVPYGLYTLARATTPRERLRLLALAAAAGLTVLGLSLLGPLQAMLALKPEDYPAADLSTTSLFSFKLSYFLSQQRPGDYIGAVPSLLTLAATFVRGGRRERWFWLATAFVNLLLALGPDLQIGDLTIPMPFRLLDPIFNGQYRAPNRFNSPMLLAMLIFAALSFEPIWARLRARGARLALGVPLLLALAVDYRVMQPFQITIVPDYPIYHEIGQEPGDWVLLEVPVSPVSGYLWLGPAPDLQFYAEIHRKRLVNGTLSRVPWRYLLYFEKESTLLGVLGGGRPMDTQAVPRELAKAVDEWPVGYVIVHQSRMPDAQNTRDILAMLNMQESVCFVRAEADLMIYRAHWHPKGCPPRTPPQDATGAYVLDLGAPGDEGFIGEYWYWQEDVGGVGARWAGGNDASRLRVALPGGRDYRMTLVATGYGEGQGVEVRVNGAVLGGCELAGGWSACEVGLPARVVGEGDLVVVLVHRGMASAAGRGESADARPLTAAYDRIIFRAQE